MKIREARFERSVASYEECPPSELPEFAFVGRSNVGKSSLINMLCAKKALARVSGKPGHTRRIHFYVVDDRWTLVDLPGYGFAKTAKTERERINETVADYLEFREELRRVFVLIDSRLEPQPIDLAFLTWAAEQQVPASLVFTKADKVKPKRLAANREQFLEALAGYVDGRPPVLTCSAQTGEGRAELLEHIDELMRM